MAVEHRGLDISLKAADNLSACRYHLATVSAADTANVCAATTDRVIGVIQNATADAAGEAVAIRISGTSKCVAGTGNVTAGDTVGPDTSGHGITVTADAKTVAGIALSSAVATGLFTLLVTPNGQRAS